VNWIQIMLAAGTAIALPLLCCGFYFDRKRDYEKRRSESQKKFSDELVDRAAGLEIQRHELIAAREILRKKEQHWVDLQKAKDRRITELRDKNAVLTGFLCKKHQAKVAPWPESRQKREGKKFNAEIRKYSEGCSQWCLIGQDGTPPKPGKPESNLHA